MCRAMVVNAAQLASYSQAKQFILGTNYVQVGFILFSTYRIFVCIVYITVTDLNWINIFQFPK